MTALKVETGSCLMSKCNTYVKLLQIPLFVYRRRNTVCFIVTRLHKVQIPELAVSPKHTTRNSHEPRATRVCGTGEYSNEILPLFEGSFFHSTPASVVS
jgi:hypothetical protein